MIEAVSSNVRCLYRISSETLQHMGSFTTRVGSKVVTMVSTSIQQVGSLIYRICSSAYRSIADLISYLFGQDQTRGVGEEVELVVERMIPSLMSKQPLKSYIAQDASWAIIELCREVHVQRHMTAYIFDTVFSWDDKYCSVMFIAQVSRKDAEENNVLVLPQYSIDSAIQVPYPIFAAILNKVISHLNLRRDDFIQCRIHIVDDNPDIRAQTWTFITVNEKISFNVTLNAEQTNYVLYTDSFQRVHQPFQVDADQNA